MAVTPDMVRTVAALARLSLEDEEVAEMTSQLNGILQHMEALAGAGSFGTGQAADATDGAPLRADRPGADPLAVQPPQMAPEFAAGFFTVPRLSSHADGDGAPDPAGGVSG